ncbi:Bug family tripartite tricarboxylate transporter substrate binding protein [Hansschlegelia sp. KR7-227]|uniref:Bug family tripartite tricarboxylate transporter substrate binding protein n=1 Tax=Hansschlegelia sp. KR7-227 TaxID=3400914 RepID=UPI003C0AEDCD
MLELHDNPSRRMALALGAGAALTLAFPARAAFPDKPVTVIVPFPPGGPNDVVGRLTAQTLTEALGAQAIVENRAGAGGATGVGSTARSEPDGYTTVLATGVGWVTHPMLTKSPSFRTEDLRPVCNVTGGPSVLAVRKDLPAKTLEELIALAKAKPGELTYASSGVGTTLHLGGELFKSVAGLDIIHVPYKGTSEVLVDLLAGRVDISFISPLVARKLVDDGRLRALATTGTKRMKGWDDTPTVAEAGAPGYVLDSWYPLLAPAGTPDEVVSRLNQAVAAGVKAPEAAHRLEGLGFIAIGSSVAEAEAYQRAETEKWTKLIRDAKLQAD